MENIWIFLIVAGVMGFRAFIEKSKKELDEHTQPDLSDMDMPELHFPEEENDIPDREGSSYYDEVPQPITVSPEPRNIPDQVLTRGKINTPPSHSKPLKQRNRHHRSSSLSEEGVRVTTSPSSSPIFDGSCEFDSPSLDELRKALIWSEILNRKY